MVMFCFCSLLFSIYFMFVLVLFLFSAFGYYRNFILFFLSFFFLSFFFLHVGRISLFFFISLLILSILFNFLCFG